MTPSMRSLPFVGEGKYWALPISIPNSSNSVCDYHDGCVAGSASAHAFLKFLATSKPHERCVLQLIALDMAKVIAVAGDNDFLTGQIVGFFSEIERWAHAAAQQCIHLASKTEHDISARLQDALRGGPSKRFKEEVARERSEQCRQAAKARWAKALKSKQRKARR